MKKIKIEKMQDVYNNFKYNVKIILDGTYCGCGQYFKTLKEARAYKKEIKRGLKWLIKTL